MGEWAKEECGTLLLSKQHPLLSPLKGGLTEVMSLSRTMGLPLATEERV